jgi:RecA-family ATPase
VGVPLLAGAPKAGKTRLVTQIALGVSTGESVLEKIGVEKCGVLCLFLEDSK